MYENGSLIPLLLRLLIRRKRSYGGLGDGVIALAAIGCAVVFGNAGAHGEIEWEICRRGDRRQCC